MPKDIFAEFLTNLQDADCYETEEILAADDVDEILFFEDE